MSRVILTLFATLVISLLSAEDKKAKAWYADLNWSDGNNPVGVTTGEKDHRIIMIEMSKANEVQRLVASLNVEPLMGKVGEISIRARRQSATVTSTPVRIELGLVCTDANGSEIKNSSPVELSGKVWKTLTCKFELPDRTLNSGVLEIKIPDNSERVELDLDSLKIISSLPLNADFKVSYPDRIARDVRRRGFVLPFRMTDEDFQELEDWKVNLVRKQIGHANTESNRDNLDLEIYDRWLSEKIDEVEMLSNMAQKHGIRLVVSLASAPGARVDHDFTRMNGEKKYLDHFIESWKMIATRLKGNPGIWAYELINEPLGHSYDPYDSLTIQKRAVEAIRAIDPDTPIIVEPNQASPKRFKDMPILPMHNIIYSAHMYEPHDYTHQGTGRRQLGPVYPGEIGGIMYNKEKLREYLQPLRDFQLQHNAVIYIGEFSVACWSVGGGQYLADCIELFEEYGWNWTYHAYHGWVGWNLECEGESFETRRKSTDNPRKRAVQAGLQKNQR